MPNIIDTIERVRALLPSVVGSVSPAIHVDIALDRSQTIRASVKDVETSLILSVLLVVLVVFVFLRNVRATLIPSVAVPVSLVATFGVMYMLGYSLDNLSLMALTISTGFVVDDAIVVTENVSRYMEAGDDATVASLKGAEQVGFTIVSITASLLAVFIPLLLMADIVGRLFREFAVTLSVAIAVSALVSLTVTPAMCSRLLRNDHGAERSWAYRASERVFDGMLAVYERGLRWSLEHRWFMLALTLGAIGLNVQLIRHMPMGLFPQQDTGMLMGSSDAPQDISFPALRERQMAINAIVQSDPDVAHVVSSVGSGTGSAGNTGNLFIELRSRPQRRSSADEVIARLRPRLSNMSGIILYLQARAGSPHHGAIGANAVPIHARRYGSRRAPNVGSEAVGRNAAPSRAERRGDRSAERRAAAAGEHRSRYCGALGAHIAGTRSTIRSA